MQLCFVVGTRPEIIKMAPIIKECQRKNTEFFILHTGQHYSYNLDSVFFKELDLPPSKHNLEVGSGSFGSQVGRMLEGLEGVLVQENPSYVLAQGDTNSVLAAALTASHLRIPFVHVEAGLRSYNKNMQEERNRILADRLADILLPPTELAREILAKENHDPSQTFVTGNTIVDALYHYLPVAQKLTSIQKYGLEPRGYFLVTVHRAENTDQPEVLEQILDGLGMVGERHGLPIIFPIHPRTRTRIGEFGLQVPKCLCLIEPVGFFDFLLLESQADLVFTDSGGVQEECCILGVPCITIRDDTERPETLHVGSNMLAGTTAEGIVAHVEDMLSRPRNWDNPFGDGTAAPHIVDILIELGKE